MRPTGAYWGAGGEQIDTLSGNLNFTLPLLKAQGRGGWSAGLALSYNSQMWRQDSGGAWGYGADVGYGFGWRLMAGSIAPYWSDPYTLDHYVFTDSSGADYALRVNTNGIWTMGCTSGGGEPDVGWQYPTMLKDTNGNQVLIRYQTGLGAGYADSSARIAEIEDVRAVWYGSSDPRYLTYTFTYNSDPTPHLISITNRIGTSEAYTFPYANNQPLVSPFSPPVFYGGTTLLLGLTNNVGAAHSFQYSAGAGELTKVVLPYGGWEHQSVTFNAGRTIREALHRYLLKAPGAAEAHYFLWRDPAESTAIGI